MYKKRLGIIFTLVLMCAYTNNSGLDTRSLEVENKDINTTYKPVRKEIAEEALPYEMKYPSYFPFEKENTKVIITGWENSEERVVTSIRYPSTEENTKWEESSITQPAIPRVEYSVANFDRYYSKYAGMSGYNTIKISDGLTGFIKINEAIDGAELHWFDKEKEYNLQLAYFSENSEELKAELIKIAASI
ncbi:hypothetical protein [Thalassobacillus sp. CUG 92003]|uniref:hypothetical protein n=1 Tax=Thalassobacillus sp. CUG 92003 TaxID=2736641 RepID=UPI0015E72C24|nr:hypothetical protein [Thalassobacillus sp. CUG 92003]